MSVPGASISPGSRLLEGRSAIELFLDGPLPVRVAAQSYRDQHVTHSSHRLAILGILSHVRVDVDGVTS